MKSYEKPIVTKLEGTSESIYMASGAPEDEEPKKCRFGRTEASPTIDKCQSCCKTNGVSPDMAHTYKEDFTTCIDNMPLKD